MFTRISQIEKKNKLLDEFVSNETYIYRFQSH